MFEFGQMLLVAAAAWALFWTAALVARWRVARSAPRPRPRTIGVTGAGPSVSVIIPARDEESRLEAALAAMHAQELSALQVIVVDDGSRDRTLEIARGHGGVQVIALSEDLPAGWLGKPRACAAGAVAAEGEWLLFLDADVRLEPGAIEAALTAAEALGADLLSGPGRVECHSFLDHLLLPAVFELILSARPPGGRGRPMAIGQFILVRRDVYEAAGGHQSVAESVIEDIDLAAAIAAAGGRVSWINAADLYRVRMYDDPRELWRGWRKNLFAGLDARLWRVPATVAMIAMLVVAPTVALIAMIEGARVGVAMVLLGLSAVTMHATALQTDRLLGFSARRLPLFVPGQVAVAALLVDSTWHSLAGTTIWKGRRLPARGIRERTR